MKSSSGSRRQFLKQGVGSMALLPLFSHRLAAARRTSRSTLRSSSDAVLVVVELTGGNDGLNTVVPYRDDRYRAARPTLAVESERVLRLDDSSGLHPALASLMPAHENGELAVVQSVGYGDPDRSHFRSRDIWHTARREPEGESAGWLGRAAEYLGDSVDLPAVVVGQSDVPLLLRGLTRQPPAVRDLQRLLPRDLDTASGERRERALEELARAKTGAETLDFLRMASAQARGQAKRLQRAMQNGLGTPVSSSELGGKLGVIGGLLGSGQPCPFYYVSQDGYDTHAAQGPRHTDLLQELGDALGGFQQRLRENGHAQRVVTFVFSEFGRRVEENRSRGTDHGAGGPCLLLSGGIRGGVQGEAILDDLLEGDVRPRTDFRRICASLLGRFGSLPTAEILGEKYPPLPLFT